MKKEITFERAFALLNKTDITHPNDKKETSKRPLNRFHSVCGACGACSVGYIPDEKPAEKQITEEKITETNIHRKKLTK